MLGMPAPTQFDLNFRLLGIPVRINPFFWVMAAVLGWVPGTENLYRERGVIGPRVDVPAGAGPQAELLGRFGRAR